MKKVLLLLCVLLALTALTVSEPPARAETKQVVSTQTVKTRTAREVTHEEHVERMTIIICATVILILLVIVMWRKMK